MNVKENTKKLAVRFFICLVCISPLLIHAVEQIPVLGLQEVFRIEDTGVDFFFKSPSSPVVDKEGFIFVDDQKQLLMFSPSGKYLRNFYTEGQGPFEMTGINGIWPGKDQLVFSNQNPHKLIWFDRNGNPLKETRIRNEVGYTPFLTYFDGRFYYLDEEFFDTKNKAVYVDIPVRLLSVNPAEDNFKVEPVSFPKKYFVMNTNWIMNVYFVQTAVYNDNSVFIAYDGNYKISRLDLKTMSLTPWFKQSYEKVAIKDEWKKILKPSRFPHYGPSGKEYRVFERKALDDVQRIWINGDKIWVITSTFDESTRRVQVDVFDSTAKKKGSMRLSMPGGFHLFTMSHNPMTLHEEKLYIFEASEDGVYSLVCYRLLNVPDWAKSTLSK